jgi:phosphonate transport system substrate-binding protein
MDGFGITWTRLCRAWVGVLACLMSAPAWSAGPAVYTVAVVPQFPATEINRVWAPILDRVGQEAGVVLQLKLSRDIPGFEEELLAGKPDFAYMNPYHQVMARKAQGYVPLVRDSTLLTGILVVRQDDPIQSVKELEGRTVAFPAPNAFGASLMIRAHLSLVDKISFTPLYAKTHTNAYRQAIVGKAAAAGGLRATLEKEPPEVRANLRVLLETPGAPPHPLSAHPRVPIKVQQAVRAAMLKLAGDTALREFYQDIPMAQPVAADHARDYQPLEKYRLERFVE